MPNAVYRSLSTTLAALCLAAGAAAAQGAAALAPIERQAGVEYRTGGIGVDESTAFEKESRDWPLTVIFAIQEGTSSQYAADVAYTVRDDKGATVLQGKTSGPYLLARLAPGRYVLDAVIGDVPRQHAFRISAGGRHRHVMLWSAQEHPGLRDAR